MTSIQGLGSVGATKGYRKASGQEESSNRKTWRKLPVRAIEGKALQSHFEAEYDDNPAALKKMVTDMLRMSREVSEPCNNFRDGQWPVDEKLMGSTRIPVREIEHAANDAYHAITGQILDLPMHLRE